MFFKIRKKTKRQIKRTEVRANQDNRLIGYRIDITGWFGYKFYQNGSSICTVSSIVAPSVPVMIHSDGIAWESNFVQSTIVPGLSRSINDARHGKQIARIVYERPGEYEIDASIKVRCTPGEYTFYKDSRVIATIKKVDDKSMYPRLPDTIYDFEPYFEVTTNNEIPTQLLMVILAFPMLQFAF